MAYLRSMLLGVAAMLAGGAVFAQTVTIESGNGQVICPTCALTFSHSFQPLVVVVRDAAGTPVPNATVTWTVSSPEGALAPAQGFVTFSTTDTDTFGRTSNPFEQSSLRMPFVAYVQSRVTASALGASAVFVETTTWSDASSGISQITSPTVISPSAGERFDGAIGEVSGFPLQIEVSAAIGGGVPDVEVRLEAVDPNAVSTATCQTGAGAAPGTVLTDARGIATCNVLFGGRPGSGQFTARIGGDFARTSLFNFDVRLGRPRVIRTSTGNNQSGNAGQNLVAPLVALVEDAAGNRLEGIPVVWDVLSGAATLFNSVAGSDAQGRVSTNVRLGALPGPVQIRVRAASDATVSAIFTATVMLTITDLQKLSGDNQSTPVNTQFTEPLVVQVNNQGQPMPNIPVTFTVASGSATVVSPIATTNAQGRAQATVFAGPNTGPIVVTATVGTFAQSFGLTVRAPGPQLTINSFVNAAGFQRGENALAPCSVAQIVAPGIAPGIQGVVLPTNLIGPLPMQLSNVSVEFGSGGFAPIYNVSNIGGQETVTVQVPCELSPGNVQVTVRVGQGSATTTVPVRQYSPGIFETVMSDGRRRGVLLRPDGTWVSLENPARRNEIIRMYVTGLGGTNPGVGTNQAGQPGVDAMVSAPVVVGVNNAGVRVLSAMYARNLTGVYEVAFEVPDDTPGGGNIPLAVAVQQGDQLVFGNGSAIPVQ